MYHKLFNDASHSISMADDKNHNNNHASKESQDLFEAPRALIETLINLTSVLIACHYVFVVGSDTLWIYE